MLKEFAGRAKEFAHSNCIQVGKIIGSNPDKSVEHCQELETPLIRAKRLKNKDKELSHSIDSLITYLNNHTDSQEAKTLLEELKQRYIEIIIFQIDHAMKKGNQYQIWKLAKEFQYFQRRLKDISPIPPWIIEYVNKSPIVRKAIENTELALSKESNAPEKEIKQSWVSEGTIDFFEKFVGVSTCAGLIKYGAILENCIEKPIQGELPTPANSKWMIGVGIDTTTQPIEKE